MARVVAIPYPASSANALGAAQAPSSGIPLTLTANYVQGDVQRTISLTSSATLSGISFHISGVDTTGRAVSEDLTGPANSTVTSANQYLIDSSKITITPNGSNVGTLTVGTGAVGGTRWVPSNLHISPFNLTVAIAAVSGTVSATVQDTPEDVATVANPTTFNHPTIASVTSATESNYAFPARNVRAINASGSGGWTFYLIQAGIAGS